MTDSSLRITEIFYSLQGESNTAGVPTVFIRLTGCPLRCNYCDTAYAFHGGERISLDEIISKVAQYDTRYVTVTGGEPLAQETCFELMAVLADKGYKVSLETSGAMDISRVDSRVSKVVDLKAPDSGESHRNLYSNIEYLDAHDQLKFVISSSDDYAWAKEKITLHNLNNRCEVFLSPAIGSEELTPTWLAEKILQDQLQVRFQIQLHKILWGDTPGK